MLAHMFQEKFITWPSYFLFSTCSSATASQNLELTDAGKQEERSVFVCLYCFLLLKRTKHQSCLEICSLKERLHEEQGNAEERVNKYLVLSQTSGAFTSMVLSQTSGDLMKAPSILTTFKLTSH